MRQPGFEPGLRAWKARVLDQAGPLALRYFYKLLIQGLNMPTEEIIKKSIKKLKKKFPELGETLERELIPLKGEEIQPRVIKKKKRI